MAITIRRLELRVRPGHLPWDKSRSYDTVDLVLDGRDLRQWLTAASTRADEDAYLGHPVRARFDDLLHGRWPGDEQDFDGRTALLGCSCTVIGCAPLLCRIQVAETTVTWSEFRGWRDPCVPYDDLAFRFDRLQYDEAIRVFTAGLPRRA